MNYDRPHDDLIDLLAPRMNDVRARQTFLVSALGLSDPLIHSLDYDQPARAFILHLCSQIKPDTDKLDRVLDELKRQLGRDDEIEALRPHLHRWLTAGAPDDGKPRSRVFLSYARADDAGADRAAYDDPARSFMRRLYNALADEFALWWDMADMPSRGEAFTAEIEAAIDACDRLVLVAAPGALASDYVRAEWRHALARCIPVTPILRRGDYDTIPAELKNIHTPDCRDARPFADAVDELRRVLRETPERTAALHHFERALPEGHIQRATPFQQARDALLSDAIRATIVSARPPSATAIYGQGGLGKSTLAIALAHDCDVRRRYPHGIIWVKVTRTPEIQTRLAEIGGCFGDPKELYVGPGTDNQSAANQLNWTLRDKRALLILDDVWDHQHVAFFRVTDTPCRLLVTSRSQALADKIEGADVRLDRLSDAEGAALIAARAGGSPDDPLYKQISTALAGHTLAVTLAAARLKKKGAGYARTILDGLNDPTDPFTHLNIDPEDKDLNLSKSLALSYEALGEGEQRRFRALGVFAANAAFDLAALAAVWGEANASADHAAEALVDASLLDWERESGGFSQHPVLRTYARALLVGAGEQDEASERHFAHYLEKMRAHDDSGTYPQMLPEVPQLRDAFAWAESRQNLSRMLDLLANAAELLRQFGFISLRFSWADACVKLVQPNDEPTRRARAYLSRGNAYRDLATVQGEDRRARLLQALADYDQALDLLRDVPLAKAQTLNNRATVYSDLATVQGEDRRARLLQALADYDQALDLRRDVPLAKATTLNNRATVYSDLATVQGEDRRARLLQALADYDQALDLRRDVPLDKATTLNNRATVYSDLATVQGEDRRARLLQALADYDQALDLRRDVPLDKATTLNNRANVYSDLATVQGEDRRARLLQALADYDQALDLLRDVPLAKATTLNNRANVYRDLATVQGEDRRARLLQALADYDQALDLRRDVPLDKAQTLNNRATVYRDLATVQGEDRRARLLQALADYDQALDLRRDVPLDKATTLNNRATVYSDLATVQGEDRRARLLQALADYDQALDLLRDVPLDKATTLNNRANVYSDLATVQGEDRRARLLQALADYDQALDLLRDVPLAKATTLNNRANVYRDLATVQGEDRRARLLQALADYDQALDLRRDVPLDKATTLNNRANVYRDLATVQGEDRRARLLQALADYDQALDLRRDVPLDKATTLNNRATVYSDLATVQGEDRRARLLQALADYDQALDLLRDVPLAKATTLNNRANVYRDLATVQGEDRRARLLQALADYDQALDLRRDVPLDKATTLNNRATVYRDLATVQGEDRRARLLQAFTDALEAVSSFAAERHAVYLNTGRRVLVSICEQIVDDYGLQFLGSLWARATGGQPLPEWLIPPPKVSISEEEAQRLADLLIAWVQTPDWKSSAAYLLQHTDDLLTDAADWVLWLLIQQNPGLEELERHRALLRKARNEGIEAAYAQFLQNPAPSTPQPSMLPEETVRGLASNTVAVKTSLPEKLDEWRGQLGGLRGEWAGRGEDYRIEVEFADALLAILDDQPPSIPPDNPYADVVRQVAAAIAAYRAGA